VTKQVCREKVLKCANDGQVTIPWGHRRQHGECSTSRRHSYYKKHTF